MRSTSEVSRVTGGTRQLRPYALPLAARPSLLSPPAQDDVRDPMRERSPRVERNASYYTFVVSFHDRLATDRLASATHYGRLLEASWRSLLAGAETASVAPVALLTEDLARELEGFVGNWVAVANGVPIAYAPTRKELRQLLERSSEKADFTLKVAAVKPDGEHL